MKTNSILLMLLVLTACGGGGSSQNSSLPAPTISDSDAVRVAKLATFSQLQMDEAANVFGAFAYQWVASATKSTSVTGATSLSCGAGSGTVDLLKGGSYTGLTTSDSLSVKLQNCNLTSNTQIFYTGSLTVKTAQNISVDLNAGGSNSGSLLITNINTNQNLGANVLSYSGDIKYDFTIDPNASYSVKHASTSFTIDAISASGISSKYVLKNWTGSTDVDATHYALAHNVEVTLTNAGATTSFTLSTSQPIYSAINNAGVLADPNSGVYKVSNFSNSTIGITLSTGAAQVLVDYGADGSNDKTLASNWASLISPN
jgi:hypothetical protein